MIFIAFGIVLLMLIAFFYFRDQSITQKLSLYESAIDDLHKRLYRIENQNLTPTLKSAEFNNSLKEIEERLNHKLNELGDPLLRAIRALKTLEDRMQKLELRVDEKIDELKQTTKSQHTIDPNRYEERIITLYKEGKSIEEIAKLTRVGIGEIELMLKLANLKK